MGSDQPSAPPGAGSEGSKTKENCKTRLSKHYRCDLMRVYFAHTRRMINWATETLET